ncbi:MAG: Xaa-Pro peptidase family protein, partial [Candidatus Aminicenantes bacterium]|nr:Xaa-Pro peptidase family protein [Candidatus Aminicenantes bacterium]
MLSRRNFFKVGGLSVAAFGFVNRIIGHSLQAESSPQQNMVADVKPLTAEDYAARIEKAKRLIAENKMDGLFLEGGTNLAYFTKVNWWRSERTFGAVFSRKHDPVWVCPAFERQRAEELIFQGQEIRTWEEHESPYSLIGGIMKDLGAAGGRLGLDPSMRHFIYHGLRKDAASLELVDGAAVTEPCRGVKTAKEVAYMDLANKITKLAYREAFKQIREGMSPRDLAAAVSEAHQKMGVSGGGGPQFGPNTAFPHGSRAVRDLQKGDAIIVDGGCGVEGYRSDITRTIFFDRPTDRQRRVWDAVRKAQSEALKAVRPGATCESADAAARKVIEGAGFGPGY